MKSFIFRRTQVDKIICVFSILIVIFLPVNIIAQKNVLSSDKLITEGLKAYDHGEYTTAAVYLFAYIQKNPSASPQVSPAYEFSNARIVTGVGTKSDGACLCAKASDQGRPDLQKPAGGNQETNATVIPAPTSGNYSKIVSARAWNCNDGGTYYITRNNNEVWWYGKGSDGGFTNVMHGTIEGNLIKGKWSDVPQGNTKNSGTILLHIDDLYNFHVTEVTGGFGGSKWSTSKGIIYDKVIKGNISN
jgi:hypothetical protein